MTIDSGILVRALGQIFNGNDTSRWNYPLAIGTPEDAPGGIGQPVRLTYTFLQTPPSYYAAGEEVFSGFRPLNAAEMAAARKALAQVSSVASIAFVESSTATGQITFGAHSMSPLEGGSATLPGYGASIDAGSRLILSVIDSQKAGDIWLSNDFTEADMQPGKQGYAALLHELGHALGLKHPFEGTQRLSADTDNNSYTVMSYTSTPNFGTVDVTGGASSYRWTIGTFVEPRSPMPADIAALQYLYGANLSARPGNDTYSWQPGERFLEALWDAGGSDTIDCSNQTLPCAIDLNPGAFSSIGIRTTAAQLRQEMPAFASQAPTPTYDGRANLAIAYNTVIEHAVGGTGADTLAGNAAANRLTGGAGNDAMEGGDGTDTAIFNSARAGNLVTRSGATATVSGPEGIDTLSDIERLQFTDGRLALDSGAGQVAGTAYRIYKAAFNRIPDAGGLSYWIGVMDLGADLTAVAGGFMGSAEFTALYGANPTNPDFLTRVYGNVLGRAPDPGGFAFWLDHLDANHLGRDQLLANFSESPENQLGVIGLIQNGIWYG